MSVVEDIRGDGLDWDDIADEEGDSERILALKDGLATHRAHATIRQRPKLDHRREDLGDMTAFQAQISTTVCRRQYFHMFHPCLT